MEIREAVKILIGKRQLINETELDLASRINDAAYHCGNVHDDLDKMKLFVDGFSPTTRTIVFRIP